MTIQGESIVDWFHARMGPSPNKYVRMIGQPDEWAIDSSALIEMPSPCLVYDESTDEWVELALDGTLHAMRVGDAGISVRGRYQVVCKWYRSERSHGLVAEDRYIFQL